MEFSEYNWATISERKFAPKCLFLASSPLGHCSFRIYPDKSHNFRNFIFMTALDRDKNMRTHRTIVVISFTKQDSDRAISVEIYVIVRFPRREIT